MNINLADEERAWVVPALYELQQDGTVSRAENWSALREDVLRKLADYGAAEHAESLVRPLDDAVEQGTDYQALAEELSSGYPQLAAQEPPALDQSEPALDSPDSEALEFEAMLPAADELAQAIIMDLGAELGQLIGSDPELAASLDGDTLVEWVAEDLAAVIDDIAKSELAWLA